MRHAILIYIPCIFLLLSIFSSCERKKNPPRDEIPIIKELLGEFERAIKEKNPAAIDSLLIAETAELGYSSSGILAEIYSESSRGTFHTFGGRSFSYTKKMAVVNCFIMADSTDSGRPAEITLIKAGDRWLIKRFDLK